MSVGFFWLVANRVGKDTENFCIPTLSHHRTYRPVYGGSSNLAIPDEYFTHRHKSPLFQPFHGYGGF